jgi:hypothetical protein
MDPDECLQRQLNLAAAILAIGDHGRSIDLSRKELVEMFEHAYDLAQAVVDLHEWVLRGGFPPRHWLGPTDPPGEAVLKAEGVESGVVAQDDEEDEL